MARSSNCRKPCQIHSTASESLTRDRLSATMVEACSRASDQLKILKLNNQERQVVTNVLNLDVAENFVSQYVEAYKQIDSGKKGWRKVYAVSRFAKPVLDVFKQANFSPECSVALGLVGLLLVQVSGPFQS
jgi:hypothetical protein